jgi:hypothetical protein
MHRNVSPEELVGVARTELDPLMSDTPKCAIDMNPTCRDDGLYDYTGRWLKCSGCIPEPTGETHLPHVHFILIGDNGGMRVQPQH